VQNLMTRNHLERLLRKHAAAGGLSAPSPCVPARGRVDWLASEYALRHKKGFFEIAPTQPATVLRHNIRFSCRRDSLPA
jgi:hypothetical protein